MAFVSQALAARNLDTAISNLSVGLTNLSLSGTPSYTANKQDIDVAFQVFETGREETVDTKFYIKYKDLEAGDIPAKGNILQDGDGEQYKVSGTQKDAIGVTMRIDCISRNQRG